MIEAYRVGDLLNCVNVSPTRTGTATIILRHYDRVGVLASALEVLRAAEINVQTMENRVFKGSNAAIGIIDVIGSVSEDLVRDLAGLEHVIQVQASERDA